MKQIVGALLLMLLIVPAAFADKKDNKQNKQKDPYQRLLGDWQGSMKVRDQRMTLILHLVMGKDGKIVATVDSPTQSLEALPAALQFARDIIVFDMPRLDAHFQGQVNGNFTKIRGHFYQQGDMGYLTLVHLQPTEEPKSIINDEPDKPTVTSDFLGDWAGDLKAGERSVRFILHIRRNREGTVATVDSPDQDTFGIKVATIVSEDTKLSFNIPDLKMTFQGTVDAYRSSITGTLTQNGKPRPLILTKS
jgi:hypothetical protein